MSGTALTLIVIGAIIAVLVLVGMTAFKKLRAADIAARDALAGIDVQLARRANLLPDLVSTIKSYADDDPAVFDEVAAARAGVVGAAHGGTVEQKAAAESRLHHAVANVLLIADNYPDLTTSATFVALRSELTDTDHKLSFARQFYNDAARNVNQLSQAVPWMFFSGFAGVKPRTFFQSAAGPAQPMHP